MSDRLVSERKVVGLWDCDYCGAKALKGTQKCCPNCGHPQDVNTKFYIDKTKIEYLDQKLEEEYGKGPDWNCGYCKGRNRHYYKFCQHCGAPHDAEDGNYFHSKLADPKPEETVKPKPEPKKQKKSGPGKLFIFAILAVLIALIVNFIPKTSSSLISGKEWSRSVSIDEWKTVQEDDWSVPNGGRVYKKQSEIHHYVDVLDHYETRSRQVSEQVYDGEETYTRYEDNGDGTFTESTYSKPRYRTEYHTETYEEPIYRKDPVYQTKYYYEIERWIPERTEHSSGTDDEPYWPEYTLSDKERENSFDEKYVLYLRTEKEKEYSAVVSQDFWNKYQVNDKVTVTTSGSRVTKINEEAIY